MISCLTLHSYLDKPLLHRPLRYLLSYFDPKNHSLNACKGLATESIGLGYRPHMLYFLWIQRHALLSLGCKASKGSKGSAKNSQLDRQIFLISIYLTKHPLCYFRFAVIRNRSSFLLNNLKMLETSSTKQKLLFESESFACNK